MNSLVNKTVFPNGLTVVTERMPYVRSVSLGVWIGAGSRTDSVDLMGMAHFIEHMLFKGTEKRSVFEIADSLESLGGSLNAFTSRDMTCYYATVLDAHLERAIDVLSDILLHSTFVPVEIGREKLVVMEEIRSAEDVPEELVEDVYGDLVLNPDPAAKSILGTEETVERFSREDITAYMSRYYSACNIVIAAAGNIEHDRIVDLVSSYFTFDGSNNYVEPERIAEISDRTIVLEKDIQQSHICYGGLTFGYTDERRNPLWLINTLLGSGMSSRLFQNIREKHGLTYNIYSFMELMKTNGFIATYAATETANLDMTLKLIRDEYRNLSEVRLDTETLERVKSQLKGSVVLSQESSSNRMSRLAKQEIFLHTYYDINDTIQQIDAVTAEQMQDVAQDVFREENLRTVIVKP